MSSCFYYKLIIVRVTDILKVIFHSVLSLPPSLSRSRSPFLFLSRRQLPRTYRKTFLTRENASARSKRSCFLIFNPVNSQCHLQISEFILHKLYPRAYACRSRGPVAGIDWCWRISKGLPRFSSYRDYISLRYRSKESLKAINLPLGRICYL